MKASSESRRFQTQRLQDFRQGVAAIARTTLLQHLSGLMTPLFQACFLVALAAATFLIGRVFHSDVTSLDLQWLFFPWIAATFVPALAMQAFSETPGDRRMELLASLPVSSLELTVGTWSAGLLILLSTLALTFPFPLTMAYLGHLDVGTALAGYVGAAGFLAVSYAIALVAAAMTRDPIGGYVLGAAMLMIIQLAGSDAVAGLLRDTWAAPLISALPQITPGYWLSELATGRVAYAGLVYFLGATALALAAAAMLIALRRYSGGSLPRRLLVQKTSLAAGWLAATATLFAATSHFDAALDLTQEREFTLHPETRAVAASAPSGMHIDVYWNQSNPDIPATVHQHAARIARLLRQIASLSDDHITVRMHEPAPDTEVEDEALLKGIKPVSLSTGGHFMLGAVFSRGDRQSAIAYFAPDRAPVLEYDVASSLAALGRDKTPRIGILSPLLTPSNVSEPRQGLAMLEEIKRQYDVAIIPHFASTLPDDLDTLLVIDATILKPEMLREIDRFVMAGHGLIVMIDPFVRFNPASNAVVPDPGADINDISDLLLRYGLRFNGTDVVGDPSQASTVGAGDQRFLYPFWLRIRSPQLSSTHPVAAGLNELGFAEAGSFAIVDPLHATPVVTTTDQAGTIARGEFTNANPQTLASRLTSKGGAHTIIAAIRGSLKSAFPQESNAAGPDKPVTTQDSRIFAIADVDWIFDPLTYAGGGNSGTSRPLNDNITALSNMIEAAVGRPGLSGIRSRGRLSRPFVRVSDMLAASQARYKAKENELLERITRVEGNIRKVLELSGAKSLDQLPDDIQGQVKELRLALLPQRRELRAIRQKMREDVEGLGWWLAVINLLAAPLLVAGLAAVARLVRRRHAMRLT